MDYNSSFAENKSKIAEEIKRLFTNHKVIEIRYQVKNPNGSDNHWCEGGYFDDLDICIREVEYIDSKEDTIQIWTNQNILDPEFTKDKVLNKLLSKKQGYIASVDANYIARCDIFIDCDSSVRPAKENATDAEKDDCLEVAEEVSQAILDELLNDTLMADSGNGNHLKILGKLPIETPVKEFLEILNYRFGNERVKIDSSVASIGRMCKLYGTMTRKGPNTPDRPHRRSGVNDTGAEGLITIDDILKWNAKYAIKQGEEKLPLNSVAGKIHRDNHKGKHTKESVIDLIVKHNIKVKSLEPVTKDTELYWYLECCPFNNGHAGKDAAIFLKGGKICFNCFHISCESKTINDVIPNANKQEKQKIDYAAVAMAIVEDYKSRNKALIYSAGKVYYYSGTCYKELESLKYDIHDYLSANKLPQAKNMVANLEEIVTAKVRLKNEEFGTMPFWKGENSPFDKPQEIITFKNGMMNVDHIGTLIPHSENWCSTYCLPYSYDPSALCPDWLPFLNDSLENDPERIDMLQKYMGLLLSQETKYQKALLLTGQMRSGKGTIQRIITALAGENNCTGFKLESLATTHGDSLLINKSVAIVGELELAGNRDKAKIIEAWKGIIGEDARSIEPKFKDPFSMRLKTRFVVACNSNPNLKDSSGALNQRLLIIPFELTAASREDLDLENKLLKQLAGIANWALAGLIKLRKEGFILGAKHKEAFKEYSTLASPAKAWLTERAIIDKSISPGMIGIDTDKNVGNTSVEELFKDFSEWWKDQCLSGEPSNAVFGRDLKTILPKVKRKKIRTVTGQIWVYEGILLKPLQLEDLNQNEN